MIKRILFLFLLLSAGSSYALGDAWWGVAYNGVTYGDKDAATVCKEIAGPFGGYTYSSVITEGRNGSCLGTRGTATTPSNYANLYLNYCLDDKPYFNTDSNTCTSVAPPPPDPCAKNDVANPYVGKFYYAGPIGTPPKDDGTCQVTNPILLRCYTDAKGAKYCYYQYTKTKVSKETTPVSNSPNATGSGSTASGTPLTPIAPTDKPSVSPKLPPEPNSTNCPAGTVQAGLDSGGIPICIGMGTKPDDSTSSIKTDKAPTTTTNADGSSTKTQISTVVNPDGSTTTTTTTTTTGQDGTVTTGVNKSTGLTPAGVQGVAGAAGAAGADGKDAKGLCEQNPLLTICQNSSVSGGCDATGTSTATCTGDAIQCATLRAAASIQCKQKADDDALKASSQYALGSAAAAGADPAAASMPSASKADVVQMGNIQTTGWLGAGSYFKDKTISFGGQTVVLPLSQGAQYMIGLRYITMLLASLACLRIIRGTFSNGV